MKAVGISVPFGDLIPDIYCPACGKVVFNSEGAVPDCSHVLFIYHDIASEFTYLKEGFEDSLQKAQEMAEEGSDTAPEILADLIVSESALCLAVTASGMACGPVSFTSYFAFDFAASEKPV